MSAKPFVSSASRWFRAIVSGCMGMDARNLARGVTRSLVLDAPGQWSGCRSKRPDTLGHLLGLAGAQWILGVDFFKDRRIVLDFARGRVVDCR